MAEPLATLCWALLRLRIQPHPRLLAALLAAAAAGPLQRLPAPRAAQLAWALMRLAHNARGALLPPRQPWARQQQTQQPQAHQQQTQQAQQTQQMQAQQPQAQQAHGPTRSPRRRKLMQGHATAALPARVGSPAAFTSPPVLATPAAGAPVDATSTSSGSATSNGSGSSSGGSGAGTGKTSEGDTGGAVPEQCSEAGGGLEQHVVHLLLTYLGAAPSPPGAAVALPAAHGVREAGAPRVQAEPLPEAATADMRPLVMAISAVALGCTWLKLPPVPAGALRQGPSCSSGSRSSSAGHSVQAALPAWLARWLPLHTACMARQEAQLRATLVRLHALPAAAPNDPLPPAPHPPSSPHTALALLLSAATSLARILPVALAPTPPSPAPAQLARARPAHAPPPLSPQSSAVAAGAPAPPTHLHTRAARTLRRLQRSMPDPQQQRDALLQLEQRMHAHLPMLQLQPCPPSPQQQDGQLSHRQQQQQQGQVEAGSLLHSWLARACAAGVAATAAAEAVHLLEQAQAQAEEREHAQVCGVHGCCLVVVHV